MRGRHPLHRAEPPPPGNAHNGQPCRLQHHHLQWPKRQARRRIRLKPPQHNAAPQPGNNNPRQPGNRQKPAQKRQHMRPVQLGGVCQLYRRHPRVLRIDSSKSRGLRRQQSQNLPQLRITSQQKRNTEDPPPAHLKRDNRRPAKHPAHLPHQRLGSAQRPRHCKRLRHAI